MSVTKELIEQENLQLQTGNYRDVHLHKEGSFLFRRICNLAESNISIYNAEKQLR